MSEQGGIELGADQSSAKLPNDIVVTQVSLDEPGPPNGEEIIAEAEGNIFWRGTIKRISLKLGNAELQLTYDTEDEQSAVNAAILIASAQMGLVEIDGAEFSPEDHEEDEIDPDDARFLLDQIDKSDSDYDDELEGWVNYSTIGTDDLGRRILKVNYESDGGQDGEDDKVTLTARWALEYLDGDTEVVTHDLTDNEEIDPFEVTDRDEVEQ